MKKVGQYIRDNLVKYLQDGLENPNAFVVNYSKLSGDKMNSFRKSLKKAGAKIFVSKNSLARLALKKKNQEKIAERLDGQTAFIWSNEDSVEVTKALTKFIKETEGIHLRGGFIQGAVLDKSEIERLADLPSKSVLQAKLLQTMMSPLTQLAYVLNGKTRDLLSILKQLSEKKGGN